MWQIRDQHRCLDVSKKWEMLKLCPWLTISIFIQQWECIYKLIEGGSSFNYFCLSVRPVWQYNYRYVHYHNKLTLIQWQRDCPVLEVRLTEADPDAFKMVLDFIYTDQIDPTRGCRERHQSNEVVLSMMQVCWNNFYLKRFA